MLHTFTSFLALKDPALLASLGLLTPDMLPSAANPLHPVPPHGQYPLDPDPIQSTIAHQDQELLLLQEQAT